MSTNNSCKGIGGAPTRATTLPESAAERKKFPVASGVLDYFPDSIVAISNLSQKGNDQHNPGKPLHWDRSKSGDEADTLLRHFLQRGTIDTDGVRHSVKMAWRALALLQKEIESERQQPAEQSAQYPRYWILNHPCSLYEGTVYRAVNATDPGAVWRQERWGVLPGGSMEKHAAKWVERFTAISAEEAKAKGAQV